MMLWKDDYKKLIQADKEGEDYVWPSFQGNIIKTEKNRKTHQSG
jgi:hypothetical protein